MDKRQQLVNRFLNVKIDNSYPTVVVIIYNPSGSLIVYLVDIAGYFIIFKI